MMAIFVFIIKLTSKNGTNFMSYIPSNMYHQTRNKNKNYYKNALGNTPE